MVDTESIKYLLEDFDDDYDYDYQDEDEEKERGIILRFLCIEKKIYFASSLFVIKN